MSLTLIGAKGVIRKLSKVGKRQRFWVSILVSTEQHTVSSRYIVPSLYSIAARMFWTRYAVNVFRYCSVTNFAFSKQLHCWWRAFKPIRSVRSISWDSGRETTLQRIIWRRLNFFYAYFKSALLHHTLICVVSDLRDSNVSFTILSTHFFIFGYS